MAASSWLKGIKTVKKCCTDCYSIWRGKYAILYLCFGLVCKFADIDSRKNWTLQLQQTRSYEPTSAGKCGLSLFAFLKPRQMFGAGTCAATGSWRCSTAWLFEDLQILPDISVLRYVFWTRCGILARSSRWSQPMPGVNQVIQAGKEDTGQPQFRLYLLAGMFDQDVAVVFQAAQQPHDRSAIVDTRTQSTVLFCCVACELKSDEQVGKLRSFVARLAPKRALTRWISKRAFCTSPASIRSQFSWDGDMYGRLYNDAYSLELTHKNITKSTAEVRPAALYKALDWWHRHGRKTLDQFEAEGEQESMWQGSWCRIGNRIE